MSDNPFSTVALNQNLLLLSRIFATEIQQWQLPTDHPLLLSTASPRSLLYPSKIALVQKGSDGVFYFTSSVECKNELETIKGISTLNVMPSSAILQKDVPPLDGGVAPLSYSQDTSGLGTLKNNLVQYPEYDPFRTFGPLYDSTNATLSHSDCLSIYKNPFYVDDFNVRLKRQKRQPISQNILEEILESSSTDVPIEEIYLTNTRCGIESLINLSESRMLAKSVLPSPSEVTLANEICQGLSILVDSVEPGKLDRQDWIHYFGVEDEVVYKGGLMRKAGNAVTARPLEKKWSFI